MNAIKPVVAKNQDTINELQKNISDRQNEIVMLKEDLNTAVRLYEVKRNEIFDLKSQLLLINSKIEKLKENVVEDPEETLRKKEQAEAALKQAQDLHQEQRQILDKNMKTLSVLEAKFSVFSQFEAHLQELYALAQETSK